MNELDNGLQFEDLVNLLFSSFVANSFENALAK